MITIPLQGAYRRNTYISLAIIMYENIHGSIIINSPKLNTTHIFIKLSQLINKMSYTYMMEYYTSVKMNKLQLNSIILMDLTILKWREASPTQRGTERMTSLTVQPDKTKLWIQLCFFHTVTEWFQYRHLLSNIYLLCWFEVRMVVALVQSVGVTLRVMDAGCMDVCMLGLM